MCGIFYDIIERRNRRQIAGAAVGSALVGATVGVIAALLLAPQSGEETWDDIQDFALTGMKKAKRQGRRVGRSIHSFADGVKNAADDAMDEFD